ncbi:MAG: hypothetical protein M5R40_23970 [Anaerolineae bacterium]|nr:hypothetical protein [Anaerolineae bacterium]
MRVILLLLLNIALIALAAVILVPRLTGSTPQGAPTAEATETEPADGSPTAPSATVTSPTVAATERPTSAASPTPRPTRRPTATATESAGSSAGPPLDTMPEGESADVEPPSGPPSEELTGPAVGVDEANRVYRSANYSISFPEGWIATVKQEGGPVSQISLSRGAEDISEGPLPEAFAFAAVDVFAASGESVAQLLASAQTVATTLVSASDIAREIDTGEVDIGGEAGAFEYYMVVSGPASGTEVFVYAAAATVGDRDFVFMLFSTDEADREIAEAILETVTFERAE